MPRLDPAPRPERLRRRRPVLGGPVALAWLALTLSLPAAVATAQEEAGAVRGAPPQRGPRQTLDVEEFRVEGSTSLPVVELERALAPFLGPGRTLEDVEAARAALERAHADQGFQSVTVAIPRQTVRDGVVTLQVNEGRVGRLHVLGARWFLPSDVRRLAPSVAEGTVPNFNDIVRDIYALNQHPDRRVTPALRAGAAPGTVDVDLNVEDRLPLHGSVEVTNRQSANTTRLRLSGAVHYDNLWQEGHSLSVSFQSAPQRLEDGKVFLASYLARSRELPGVTLTVSGVAQDSDVSVVKGIAAQGRGRILGARLGFTLPAPEGFFNTLSAGLDVKRFEEQLRLGADRIQTPITYWPVTTQYAAAWSHEASQTQLLASVIFALRPAGSDAPAFDAKRYGASGSFLLLRGELSRTQELPAGLQLHGRLQGQWSPGPVPGLSTRDGWEGDPLIGAEQFMIGGAESVRGYLEAEAAGDHGALATLEVRSPSLPGLVEWRWPGEARLLAFFDTARAGVAEALPDQRRVFLLRSAGGGLTFRLFERLSGSAEVGVPLLSSAATKRDHPRFHLRLAGEF